MLRRVQHGWEWWMLAGEGAARIRVGFKGGPWAHHALSRIENLAKVRAVASYAITTCKAGKVVNDPLPFLVMRFALQISSVCFCHVRP